MKRSITILSFLLMANLISHAQLTKGNYVLDFTGSYVESGTGSGVTMSSLNTKDKSLEVDCKIGKVLSNHFVLGIGVGYAHDRDERTSYLCFQTESNVTMIQAEDMEIKSHIIMPTIYMKYFKSIIGKFQFAVNMNAGFGFLSSAYSSSVASGQAVIFTDLNQAYLDNAANTTSFSLSQREWEQNVNVLSLALEPEFHYFITEKLGAMVFLGGIRYTHYDYGDHDWSITINPSTWAYGLFLKFGKPRTE